jgi:hypothetical protein
VHPIDRMLWWFALVLPAFEAPWLHVFSEPGPVVGADWLRRHAAERGVPATALPDGGLMPDTGLLAGPGLDPTDIHPALRRFYEHTARAPAGATVTHAPFVRAALRLWRTLIFGRWQQLCLPFEPVSEATNEIFDVGGDRVWLRRERYGVMFVARYEIIRVADERDPCVRMAFPVPGGAMIALFRVEVRDGGIRLHEDDGVPGQAGLYLVPSVGKPRYLAALREELRLTVDADGPVAVHRFWWWRFLMFTMHYRLSESG